MKKCEELRTFLLTDYLDGEADTELKARIEAHLDSCPACRGIFEAAQKKVRVPLRNAGVVEPPESVWLRIKESIEGEREPETRVAGAGILDFLGSFMRMHKPAFAVTTVISVLIIGLLIVRLPQRNRYVLTAYLQEQSQYFVNGNGDTMSVDMGTSIEEFFF